MIIMWKPSNLESRYSRSKGTSHVRARSGEEAAAATKASVATGSMAAENQRSVRSYEPIRSESASAANSRTESEALPAKKRERGRARGSSKATRSLATAISEYRKAVDPANPRKLLSTEEICPRRPSNHRAQRIWWKASASLKLQQ